MVKLCYTEGQSRYSMTKTAAKPLAVNSLAPVPAPPTNVTGRSRAVKDVIESVKESLSMIEEKDKNEILKSISLSGSASIEYQKINNIVLGSRTNLNHIAGVSSGSLKVYPSISKRFNLILSIPSFLNVLSPFEIRCVLCKRVISYPCWYYSIKYAVNHFHYFVCFDSDSPNKVSTKCYRRDV